LTTRGELARGTFSVIDGTVALSKSSSYVASARCVFSDLRTCGWIVSAVGAVELLAAFAILGRAQWARWFGMVMASLGALAQFAFMQSYPWWSLTVLAMCIFVVYGLAVYGAHQPVAEFLEADALASGSRGVCSESVVPIGLWRSFSDGRARVMAPRRGRSVGVSIRKGWFHECDCSGSPRRPSRSSRRRW
jgi:hypothetical protein